MARAQCIVYRNDRILMVQHRDQHAEWWCLPGGGVHEGESASDAALRELTEECCVGGTIVRATSVITYDSEEQHFTFLVDIGEQEPRLGHDPEFVAEDQILVAVRWLALDEIPERDRTFLFEAGLLGVGNFARIVESWKNDASYLKAEPDPALEVLKERGWREVAAIDQALAQGRIDEDGWHAGMAGLIKPAYLAADNPYAQAGHSGNTETWEASRGFIAEALHRDGTFLDAGCASGILMESVQRWGARKNLRIDPHGVDIVPEFVQLARQRLPHWADRIHVGNIRTWRPANHRFDFVFIRPDYAPAARRVDLVRHIIDHVLIPGGRIIIFVGAEEKESRRVEASISSAFPAHGRVEIPHSRDSRLVRRLFWIDGPYI